MPAKRKNTRKAKPAARAASKPAKAAKEAKAATAAKEAKVAKDAKPAKETAPAVRRTSAELHFTETTILRGEAAEPGEELPSGATHEIAGHDDCGQPILKRKRFSIY
jgi:hypothetical protein